MCYRKTGQQFHPEKFLKVESISHDVSKSQPLSAER